MRMAILMALAIFQAPSTGIIHNEAQSATTCRVAWSINRAHGHGHGIPCALAASVVHDDTDMLPGEHRWLEKRFLFVFWRREP